VPAEPIAATACKSQLVRLGITRCHLSSAYPASATASHARRANALSEIRDIIKILQGLVCRVIPPLAVSPASLIRRVRAAQAVFISQRQLPENAWLVLSIV
jgi:hypothetical protein